jgi:hypothetical protein
MKFLCLKCDEFMDYEKHESVDTLRLGIEFGCKVCGTRVAMVTNPGETQLVSGLGVKIGGRTVPPQPMEFTREALQAESGATKTATVDMGKCPFSTMLTGGTAAAKPAGMSWTATAEKRLDNVPAFARSFAKMGVEQYAKEKGLTEINDAVMDEYRKQIGM